MKKFILSLFLVLAIPMNIIAINEWKFDGQDVSKVAATGTNVYLYNIGAKGFAYPSLTYGVNGSIAEAATWMKLWKTFQNHKVENGEQVAEGDPVTAADGYYFLETSSLNLQLPVHTHGQGTLENRVGCVVGLGEVHNDNGDQKNPENVYFDRYAGEYIYSTQWKFEKVDKDIAGKENAYLISTTTDDNRTYYIYIENDKQTVRQSGGQTKEVYEQRIAISDKKPDLTAANDNYYWLLLVKENREEDIYDVTRSVTYGTGGNTLVQGGTDASFYLADHGFNRTNANLSTWKYTDQYIKKAKVADKIARYGNNITNTNQVSADNYGYYHIGITGDYKSDGTEDDPVVEKYGKYYCGYLNGSGLQEFYQDLNINGTPKDVRVGFYRVYVEGFYNPSGRKAWLFAEVPAITRDNQLIYEDDAKTKLKMRRAYAEMTSLSDEERSSILSYQKTNTFNQTVAGRAIYEDDLANSGVEDAPAGYRSNLFVYVPEVTDPSGNSTAYRGPLRIGITTVGPNGLEGGTGTNEIYFDNFLVRYYGPSEVYLNEDAYRNLANKDDKYQQDGYRFFDDDPTEGDETHKGKWDKWDVVGYELHQVGNKAALYADDKGEPVTTITNRRYSVSQVEFKDAKLILQRTITPDKWTTIVLPLNLTYKNFVDAFGAGSELAGFTGLEAGGQRIHFSTKHYVESEPYFMEANVPYLIYVESATNKVRTDQYQVWYPQGAIDINYNNEGRPFYIISNATSVTNHEPGKAEDNATVITDNTGGTEDKIIRTSFTDSGNTVSITGTYYARQYRGTDADDAVHATSSPIYAFDGGILKSYSKGINIKGFRWWMTESKVTTSAAKAFVVDGIDDPTSIEVIEMDDNRIQNATVYDVTGKVVKTNVNSLEGLPRGIYIINGKKYVK